MPNQVIGVEEGAVEVRPEAAPCQMGVAPVKDELYLIPHIYDQGTSSFYGEENSPNFRVAYWRGMQWNDGAGAQYPFATPFNVLPDGARFGAYQISLEGDATLYGSFLKE